MPNAEQRRNLKLHERSTLAETLVRESPEYVRLSLAADMSLGFRRGRFWRDARMTCVNLLLAYEDGCKANCAYCGLARERVAGPVLAELGAWDLAPRQSSDELEAAAAGNLKRVVRPPAAAPDWFAEPGLHRMLAFLETKTVWHPVGT